MKSQTPNPKSQDSSSNPSTSSGSRPAVSMADLMASYKKPMSSLNKGDLIEGTITKLTPQEVLVDINAKTEAVVMEKEKRLMRSMLAALKIGDKVTVSVLNPESDLGHPVVSLRRFMGNASWKYLEELQKEQTALELTITDSTRGGYLVTTEAGVAGFLPNSHTSFKVAEGENANTMVGKRVKAYVLELSRAANKIIFSQKEMLKDADFTKAIGLLKKNEKVSVVVTNIASFGVFVAVPAGEKKLDGLIHISEIAWEKTNDVVGMFEVGETLDAVVIGFDKDGKRVDLSIKRLTTDPFDAIAEKFAVDQAVSGKVISVTSAGLDIELSDGVAGFIRKEKLPPTVTYKEGDTVKATVAKVDKRKQRVELVPVLVAKPLTYR
ncbi:MAG: S1 RNA-binding domain-containing protein [Candidatus Levybacteria bacterium]|nr:S1 RNA-binding domain-containing protein [Candidatus Levybacteria bacterium]